MRIIKAKSVLAGVGLLMVTATASATIMYDQNVTGDVIFGSGNANGGFTTDRQNGIELGLRAKLRFDDTNQPQNVFNSNGDGTYQFDNILPPSGFSYAPNSPSTAIWNFEWSVNSNFDGSGGFLDNFSYLLEIDFDPSAGTNFIGLDPVNVPSSDNALGNNSTPNGGGLVDEANYGSNIGVNNLAQNSWNMEFAPFDFNALDVGIYDFVLSAFDSQQQLLASTSIQVVNARVPEPQTWIPFSFALLGLAWLRRRAKQ
ncbi:PEP-CTERM sorting domain-containing protein [Agarivorans sp. Toyoura001]|uniref:PEP-CTERM sorting domain-containing protein n=1 Tax=unclassified Agarivorans TaxID=2636026 RepID=UPI0010DECB16|nr:PEP-CTERM sorting domain-containing protein [Agarivorans sp. Toyoura001]GDY27707.1 hypothetical protein AHAT_35970 [Agarivorans sp. Toyoura001]